MLLNTVIALHKLVVLIALGLVIVQREGDVLVVLAALVCLSAMHPAQRLGIHRNSIPWQAACLRRPQPQP